MENTERQTFQKAMIYVFGLYPNAKLTEATTDAYWHHLRKFPLGVARYAVQEASRQSKKYPPTAPAIHEIAEVEERAAAERAKHPRPTNAPQLPRASWEGVPRTDDGQKQHILAAKNDGDKLARIWECEAVRMGVKPNEPPPQELGAKWFRQLNKFLERSGLGIQEKTAKADNQQGDAA